MSECLNVGQGDHDTLKRKFLMAIDGSIDPLARMRVLSHEMHSRGYIDEMTFQSMLDATSQIGNQLAFLQESVFNNPKKPKL